MGFFWSLKKSRELKRIVKLLQTPFESFTIEAMLASADKEKQAVEILLNVVEKDSVCAEVMRRHGATRETIAEAFKVLEANGAGVLSMGHHVAASALAYGFTLDYTLRHLQNTEPNARQNMAITLVDYFDKGEMLSVD